jgi:hypothetical protein
LISSGYTTGIAKRIQAAARRKHWSQKSEPGGEILVESADLAIE